MVKHFLELSDAGGNGLAAILNDATTRKAARSGRPEGWVDAEILKPANQSDFFNLRIREIICKPRNF